MENINEDKCTLCGEPVEYGIRFNTFDRRSYCICLECLENKVHPMMQKEKERAETDAYRE